MKNKNEQLELIQNQICKSPLRTSRRRDRATLWFSRMRQIVDSATDWRRIPPARPEQIWFHE